MATLPNLFLLAAVESVERNISSDNARNVEKNMANQLSNKMGKILRMRIYNTRFWKEECFGLNVSTLLEKATALDHIGGTYGGARKPCGFICLLLKLLQIGPDKDIVTELLNNKDHKYLRALMILYVRISWSAADVHGYLEPILKDHRKLRKRLVSGAWGLVCMDEFVEDLLTGNYSCNVSLPRLPKRQMLEASGILGPYRSALVVEGQELFREEISNLKRSRDSGLFGEVGLHPKKARLAEMGTSRRRDIEFWQKVRKELGLKPLKIP